MLKKMIKIRAINISVQQLIITDFALRQCLTGHHASTHRSHVLAVPMLVKSDRNVSSCTRFCVDILPEILCWLTASTAHTSFSLWREICMHPRCQTERLRLLHSLMSVPVLGLFFVDPDVCVDLGCVSVLVFLLRLTTLHGS